MSRYAENTKVPVDRSRAEIERTLQRYGADAFAYATTADRAMVEFSAHNRRVRFLLPLPQAGERRFTHTPTGQQRAASVAQSERDKAVRQAWRALALLIKAQMEAVEAGIVTFEVAFLPYTVLPSGRTVADDVTPLVEQAYEQGQVAPLQIEAPGN